MNALHSRAWLVGVLAPALVCGCARGPVRYEVSGKVTYKGQPVEEGIIDFEPLDSQGSKDGATILNGEYRVPKEKGLFPGRYKVAIVIGDGAPTSGNAEPSARLPGFVPGKERAPPEFNTKSTLVREVTPGGPNVFNFEIP
jgi:hypothetical protein